MVAYVQIVIAVFVTVIGCVTCVAQIKFDPRVSPVHCHTCDGVSSDTKCNVWTKECENTDDMCLAVEWASLDGRRYIYKKCVSKSFCQDFRANECMRIRDLQRCRYCCSGDLCNAPPVSMEPIEWFKK